MDSFGVSVTETARVVHGAFHPNGDYSALAPGTRAWALDVTAVAGYRPIEALELSGEAAVGHQVFSSPEQSTAHTGFGDTTVRGRWEALDEPMPFERPAFRWPAVAFVASLRMPTASADRGAAASGFSGRAGSVGSSASSEGLGAWEPAAAVTLTKTFDAWQIAGVGEVGYRFRDTYLGRDRQLAPRWLAQLGLRYAPSMSTGIGLVTDLGGEGPVAYDGAAADPHTGQRLWTVSAYGYLLAEPTGLRCGAIVRYSPPIEGIDLNATRATSIGVSLAYSVR